MNKQKPLRILVYIQSVVFFIALNLFVSSCSDGDTAIANPILSSDIKQKVEAIMDSKMSQYHIPGCMVGIWISGEPAWVTAKGKADLGSGRDLKTTDRFRIASITKTFTITVLLQLVQEGKLALDDTLDKYMPSVPNAKNITIRELCNMTSGLYPYTNDPNFNNMVNDNPLKKWTPRELLDISISHSPDFAPGTSFGYSNTNTVILGVIIEQLTGNKIQDEINKRIIQPLGLTNTYFATDPNIIGDHVHGYDYSDGNYTDLTSMEPSQAWTAGAIVSNMEDLHKWAVALAEGTLLTPAMQQERLTWCGKDDPLGTKKYCLGVYYYHYSNFIGHTGAFPGYITYMFYLPSKKATIITTINTYDFSNGLFDDVAKTVFPDEVTWTATPTPSPTSSPTALPTFSDSIQQQMEQVLDSKMSQYNSPAMIAGVWVPGMGTWVKAKGKADLSTGRDVKYTDKFRIASVTKTFTSTVLLQLVDEGKIKLDDTVDKYIANVPNGNIITIRQLCNMTSGLYNYSYDPNFVALNNSDPLTKWTTGQELNMVISNPVVFSPGEKYDYNNTNFLLQGLIIEKLTGNKLEDEIQKRIITRLGLTNTSFPTDPNITGDYVHGYVYSDGTYVDKTFRDPSQAWAAGGMISNLEDLHTWSVALCEGKLLSPATQQERLKSNGFVDSGDNLTRYCLGIYYYGNFLGHDGGLPGFFTIVYYLPSKKASFVFFAENDPHAVNETFQAISKILFPDIVSW